MEITIAEAINLALDYELNINPNLVVLGEDVGTNGGVFRVTDGLQKKYGDHRVLDTPLAETMIAGIAVGMSSMGLNVVAEFQFMGFMYPGIDQIISHASRLRNRTRGRLHCPIVYRVPFGGGIHAPEHHSESTEAMLAHIPGLQVVVPSTPQKAYSLLLASIRNPDPVIFLEPLRLYRSVKQEVKNNGKAFDIDKACLVKEGKDVTLITWGASIIEVIKASKKLLLEGINIEIIDLVSIKPIDIHTILDSVEKTRRCVIVHEAARTCGVGAEIVALLNEYAFDLLKTPILRVTGYDTIVPYAKMEKFYIPSVERIIQSIKQTVRGTYANV